MTYKNDFESLLTKAVELYFFNTSKIEDANIDNNNRNNFNKNDNSNED